jgi:mRNA interferase MazF
MEPILRGEIFYADLGNPIGSEQGGHRPVLILQSDPLNQNSPTVIVAPTTSIIKLPFLQAHCILPANRPLRERSMVLTEQVRAIDRQRLGAYIGRLQAKELRDVEQALCYSLGLVE